MGKDKFALIEWYDELRDSILSEDSIPPEAFFEGALTKIIWAADGKEYNARVVKISSNMKEILKEEKVLQAKHQALRDKQKEVQGKRNRKAVTDKGKASEYEVSKSLGERGKLPKVQGTAKQQAAKVVKEKETRQKNVEKLADMELLKTSCAGTSNDPFDLLDDDEFHERSSSGDDDDDVSALITHKTLVDLDIDTGSDTKDAIASSSNSNELINRIADLDNPNTRSFLKTLLDVFSKSDSDAKTESSEACRPTAEPIFKKGDAKVCLRDGHALLISKSLKAKLQLKSKTTLTNPVRLLKRLLEDLYGKEQLKAMSAKGTRKYKAISDPDLLAIYAFINKHTVGLEWETMIREINKKCSQLRGCLSPGADSDKEPKGTLQKSAKKPSFKSPVTSPAKSPFKSPVKSPIKSPIKSSSVRSPFKSPLKRPGKSNHKSPAKEDQVKQSPVKAFQVAPLTATTYQPPVAPYSWTVSSFQPQYSREPYPSYNQNQPQYQAHTSNSMRPMEFHPSYSGSSTYHQPPIMGSVSDTSGFPRRHLDFSEDSSPNPLANFTSFTSPDHHYNPHYSQL